MPHHTLAHSSSNSGIGNYLFIDAIHTNDDRRLSVHCSSLIKQYLQWLGESIIHLYGLFTHTADYSNNLAI